MPGDLYKPEYAEQARKLCLLGHVDTELATFFKVTVRTLHNWKKNHPEFSEAINDGKQKPDAEVAAALYKSCVGYEWTEQQPIKIRKVEYNAEGKRISETEEIVMVEVRRFIPSSPVASFFWLKNRRSINWRNQPLEGTGDASEGIRELAAAIRASPRSDPQTVN